MSGLGCSSFAPCYWSNKLLGLSISTFSMMIIEAEAHCCIVLTLGITIARAYTNSRLHEELYADAL